MAHGSYRELEVYQLAHGLGVSLHEFSMTMPKYELYEMGRQLRRSSKSISANIVEGYGRRRYKSDFERFLVYAHASCDETLEWLTYTPECHPHLSKSVAPLKDQTDQLGRKLNRFLQAVAKGHISPK